MPMLVNDCQVASGLMNVGASCDDAYEYCIIGCNELGIPGKAFHSGCSTGTGINDIAVINSIMRQETEKVDSLETLLDLYENRVYQSTLNGLDRRRKKVDEYV